MSRDAVRRRRAVLAGAVIVLVALVIGAIHLTGTGGSSSSRARATPAQRAAAPPSRLPSAAAPTAPATRPSLSGIPAGRWQALAHSLLARSEVSAARVGSTAYVVGGFTSDLRSSRAVERFDLVHGRWTRGVSLPQTLNHMSAVAYDGALYVVGGYGGAGDTSTGAVRTFRRFDPATRKWSRMPDAPVPRAAAGAAVIDHRLYVAGGRNDATPALGSLAIFDFRTGKWTLGPSLHRPREHVAAVAAAGSVWLLGGRALGQGNFTDVERYTPGARAWKQEPPLPLARSSFQAAAAGGAIVVVGGENAASTFSEVDALTPATGRWRRLADLPSARHGLGLVASGPLVWALEGGPTAGLTTSDTAQRLRVR